jgi:hypothetical protein
VERDRRRHCRGLSENVSAFATADYTFDIDGEKQRAFEAKSG